MTELAQVSAATPPSPSPQAVAPLLGALIVAYAGGFGALYLVAGLTSLVGALAVLPVRMVR